MLGSVTVDPVEPRLQTIEQAEPCAVLTERRLSEPSPSLVPERAQSIHVDEDLISVALLGKPANLRPERFHRRVMAELGQQRSVLHVPRRKRSIEVVDKRNTFGHRPLLSRELVRSSNNGKGVGV